MLKYSFEWSSETTKYNRGRSWLALALAVGSLVFAGVLVTLMGDVALDSLTNSGPLQPTLVVFLMVFTVVCVLAAISVVAVGRAVAHLQRVYRSSANK